jgi:ribose transport system permease protein
MSAMTDHVPSDAKPKPPRRRRSRARLAEASMLPVVWVLLIVVFSVAEPSKFFTHADFAGILSSQATLVIVSLALLMPLTSGDFDLSVASNAGLSAMIIAVLNVNEHLPIVLSVVIALAAGAGIGFLNGLVIIVFNVDAFIATLGMGTVLTGLTLLLSGENTIDGVSTGLVNLVDGTWFGISHLFYFAILLTLALWYVTEHTITGRRALFAGLGPVVAQLSGVKVSRLRWGAMTLSGFLAAVAGLSYVGTIGAADPVSSSGFLLPAYAAMFLGATTIAPGRFNAWGTTIATYFLATGFTGLELLGVNSWVQQVFYGGILVIAVALASGGSRLGRKSGAAAKVS